MGNKNTKSKNTEVTGKRVASAAAKVLRDPKSSRDEKKAAASALTQRPDKGRSSNKENTGKGSASAAARVLSNPRSSKAAKSAAASALTQRANRK